MTKPIVHKKPRVRRRKNQESITNELINIGSSIIKELFNFESFLVKEKTFNKPFIDVLLDQKFTQNLLILKQKWVNIVLSGEIK